MAKRIHKAGVVLPPHQLPPISVNLNTVDVINPDGIRPVYSNNAAVLMTPHDLRLLFTEIVMESPTAKGPRVELRANVTMTPTQFKALVNAVNQTLEGFEKQFGEIQWPPRKQ